MEILILIYKKYVYFYLYQEINIRKNYFISFINNIIQHDKIVKNDNIIFINNGIIVYWVEKIIYINTKTNFSLLILSQYDFVAEIFLESIQQMKKKIWKIVI